MVIRQTQRFGENWVIDKRIIKIQGEKDMVSSFENKLKNSNFSEKKDYFVSDEGSEGKVYTVVSRQLKKVICEVVNPLLRINEWEVKEEEFVVRIEDYYREAKPKIRASNWLTDEEARAMKTRDMKDMKLEDTNKIIELGNDQRGEDELERRKKEKGLLEKDDDNIKEEVQQQETHGKWTKIDEHWYFLPSLIAFLLLLL